jgi:hypothetical protein
MPQNVITYAPPMKNAMSLSGSFGELRANHLHSGIDLRVGGVEGEPVYAAAKGYVSRIVVRPNGYGNALYVAHPNGATSVYGHLQRFAPAIAAWAHEKQYAEESFFLDAALDSLAFPLRQGDQIGFAGNSGSSSGPHLHFEIRNHKQQPLNIMQLGIYKMADKIPPAIRQLVVYSFDTVQGTPLPRKHKALGVKPAAQGAYKLAGGDTVAVDGACYFGLDMLDKMDGSAYTFGVNRCTLHLNDTLAFAYNVSAFGFDETRYSNAMVDFAEKQRSKAKIIRLYVAQGNRLSIYRQVKNRGIVALKPHEKAKVCITLTDDAGNNTQLAFWVKQAAAVAAAATEKSAAEKPAADTQKVLLWFKNNTCEVGGFKVNIPTGALYESSLFEVQATPPSHNSASSVFCVKQPVAPPHRAVSVGIRASIPEALWAKAVVVCMDVDGNKSALATTLRMPYFTAGSRSWGCFFVEIDTVPPQITPVNFTRGAQLGGTQQRITLKVKDNLSEIKSYAGYVDDRWALFEHDEKNSLVHYYIDRSRVKSDAQHSIIFTASDVAGNSSTFTCTLHF